MRQEEAAGLLAKLSSTPVEHAVRNADAGIESLTATLPNGRRVEARFYRGDFVATFWDGTSYADRRPLRESLAGSLRYLTKVVTVQNFHGVYGQLQVAHGYDRDFDWGCLWVEFRLQGHMMSWNTDVRRLAELGPELKAMGTAVAAGMDPCGLIDYLLETDPEFPTYWEAALEWAAANPLKERRPGGSTEALAAATRQLEGG